MRALVWHGPRNMTLEELAKPEPGYGEVLVKVTTVGVCGSELEGYTGHSAIRQAPLVMGHESFGQITASGEGVPRSLEGQWVAVNPLVSCRSCEACLAGEPQLCNRRELIGAHRPGAFAELVAVPAVNVYPISFAAGEVAGALMEPLACIVHASQKGSLQVGERIAIIGAGALGMMTAQYAKFAGAYKMAIVDVHAGRLEIASSLGVDAAIEADAPDAGEQIREVLEGGADIVFETVGKPSTRRLAVDVLRRGGRAVLLGLNEPALDVDGNDLVRNELAILTSYAYTPRDFAQAVRVVERGGLSWEEWVEQHPLEEGPLVFKDLIDEPGAVPKAILRPQAQATMTTG